MDRLPLLDPEDLSERQREVYEKIASGPRGGVRGPLALWLHSPDFAERAQHLGEFLRYGTSLPARLSELAILAAARSWKAQYIWWVHAPIAEREGIDAAAIEAIRVSREPTFAKSDERAVYRFAMEMLREREIGDDTYRRAEEQLGRRGVIELAGILGYYSLGAITLAAAKMPAPAEEQPLP